MRERRIDEFFARYRREGDAQALARVFDGTARELLTLAGHLSRDPAEAEDLLQETFLTAIERAGSWDEERPLMPWLMGILTLEARRLRRRAAREPDPARLEQKIEPEPLHHAEALEISSALARALEQLPEVYRRVLALHIQHGKATAEIAEELDRAPGTVRVQIHRGLDLLRKTLPAGVALGAGILVTNGRGFAAVRATVLERARELGPALASQAAPVTASTAALGGIAVLLRGALVATLGLGLVGSSWFAWRSAKLADARDRTLVRIEPAGALDEASETASLSSSGAPGESRSVPWTALQPSRPVRARTGWWLVGTLADFDPSVPGDLQVSIRTGRPGDETLLATLPGLPAFEIEVTRLPGGERKRPEELFVLLDHPGCMPAQRSIRADPELFQRDPREPGRLVLRVDVLMVRAAGVITGSVSLPPGFDAGDARVALLALHGNGTPYPPGETARVRADGGYRLRTSVAGRHVVVAMHDMLAPSTRAVEVGPQAEMTVPPLRLDAGSALSGRLEPPPGASAGRAWVQASRVGGSGDFRIDRWVLAWTGSDFERAFVEAQAGGDGDFLLPGLAATLYRQTSSRIPGGTTGADPLRVYADEPLEAPDRPGLEVQAPLAGIHLVVAQTTVTLAVRGGGGPLADAWVARELEGGASLRKPTRGDGTVAVEIGGGAPFWVRIKKPGFRPDRFRLDPTMLAPDQTVVVELEPGPPASTVVFDGLGQDLAGACVRMTPLDGRGAAEVARIEARSASSFGADVIETRIETDGSLAAEIDPGRYWVSVGPRAVDEAPWQYILPTAFELLVPPGSRIVHPLRILNGGRLRIEAEGPVASLTCAIRDDLGRNVDVLFRQRSIGAAGSASTSMASGIRTGAAYETTNLEPGSYELVLAAPDLRTERIPVLVQAGLTTEVKPRLRPK